MAGVELMTEVEMMEGVERMAGKKEIPDCQTCFRE